MNGGMVSITMPTNVVKTKSDEAAWERAKIQAEKQGQAGNYAYIMSIYQQMRKAFVIPSDLYKGLLGARSLRTRTPGQIPGRNQDRSPALQISQEMRATLEKTPPKWSLARFGERPIVKAHDVVSGLGLTPAQEENLVQVVKRETNGATNVLQLRKALMQTLLVERFPPEIRQILTDRAVRLWMSDLKKSEASIKYVLEDPEGLQKAGSHGGTYYRRVPTQNGKYRYFYHQNDYEKHSGAHINGDEQRRKFIKGNIHDAVCKAGKDGCDVSTFKNLSKRFGTTSVYEAAKSLKDDGKIFYKGTKFYDAKPPKDFKETVKVDPKDKDKLQKMKKSQFHITVGRGLS